MRRAVAALVLALAGCSAQVPRPALARCTDVERLALVAQSVPSTSYVPCAAGLAEGWSTGQVDVRNGHTSLVLTSDRNSGHPVDVELTPSCDPGTASPEPARTPGGRTYLQLTGIDPRYVGLLYDVFPGGCVTYRFDFPRGPHIALMAQLQSGIGFVPRWQLRHLVEQRLGVTLDPP